VIIGVEFGNVVKDVFRYDSVIAMVLAPLLFMAQSASISILRGSTSKHPSTTSFADRLAAMSNVSAPRFFISYKWGHSQGARVTVPYTTMSYGVRGSTGGAPPTPARRSASDPLSAGAPRVGPAGHSVYHKPAMPMLDEGTTVLLQSFSGAEAFARSLARAIPSSWIDVCRLPNGAPLHGAIARDLSESLASIVLLTPGYIGSVNCMFEFVTLLHLHHSRLADPNGRGFEQGQGHHKGLIDGRMKRR